MKRIQMTSRNMLDLQPLHSVSQHSTVTEYTLLGYKSNTVTLMRLGNRVIDILFMSTPSGMVWTSMSWHTTTR